MKIAIFENEWVVQKVSFDIANNVYFNNKYSFEQYNNSQEFGDLNKIVEYEFAIIDLDLTPDSKLDGYQLIKQIMDLKVKLNCSIPKIIILTGHETVIDQLKQRELPIFPIINKPVDYVEIADALKQ